jgi:hypothetical protein
MPVPGSGGLARRAAEAADRLDLRRELDLPAWSVEEALRLLPEGAAVPAVVPGRDAVLRLTADCLRALGELLEPGDPLRAGLLIGARGPQPTDAGDTFDQQTRQEWQRKAWRLAIALLLTAGSATGAALDGRVADAIQSATGMIAALAVVDALRPPRPADDDEKPDGPHSKR